MSKENLFYGWKVVGALFVMLMFSSGFGFYNHSVIIQVLVKETDFAVTTASLAVTFFFLMSGVSGLVIAPLLEKYDVRLIVGFGALVSSGSLVALGYVSTLVELFIVYGLFGIGFSASGLLPSTTLVARWFETSRAKALSIASTGLSVGGVILTPFSAYVLDVLPRGTAFPGLGILYLVCVLPIAVIILRSYPGDIDQHADGAVGVSTLGLSGIDAADAIRQHFFWGLSVSYVLTMAAQVGGITHQFGVLTERLTTGEAAWGIAIMPAFSVIGRLAGGFILAKVSTIKFTLLMMIIQSVSLLTIGVSDGIVSLYLALALFGVSVGNLLMLQPLLIAEIYGLKHYARLYSWSNLITVLGVSSGPILLGWLFGYSGSYQLAYVVAGVLAIASALLFGLISPPVKSSSFEHLSIENKESL